MNDGAFELLAAQLAAASGPALWVVDEGMAAAPGISAPAGVAALTNRCDVAARLRAAGWPFLLNDYALAAAEPGPAAIYYRVSKEKAVVHRVLNEAARLLPVGGRLYLSGGKQEGIKTYIDKAAALLGERLSLERAGRGNYLAVFAAGERRGAALDDRDYARLRPINPGADTVLLSKPGIFGWNKIDAGSAFLAAQLPGFLDALDSAPRTVLDLGCGYGYLGVTASQWLDARFVATDNNVAAVAACEENFRLHGVRGEVVLDDCAASLASTVDLVLCNPPFHRGFGTERGLTERFVEAAARLLRPAGWALFVTNAFIPLERLAALRFAEVALVAQNKSFKVLALRR